MALQPPRLDYYATAEEAHTAIQAHASAQGYGLAKYRSKPDRVDIRACPLDACRHLRRQDRLFL
ncbi:uncharacterized protein BDZ99DRAFT_460150 [Mytilinidion resinicola]|uniref:Uncharacterized protein n=1 Tax=Mytilinidion resinicola TaxID=574789 RepID=A0A6A6YXP5_9PEZI|nr:uncharacterized protein BDZ99DRAFT_460150 [Mytilinidion resinicola]KAF2812774.1 hypothetical protein BDZ99DRAFT_460150 [Mytilinidion resinicola]